ncbi:DNA-binding CsgD family transcriptional regulator [Saccharothrix ecbatanensis]|uniref:DNA-binding CsgD family transcriptional regulator n=1 Tax=Saccharothrix ecbatanensis TaxID=1105145 RepID=A0A7W9HF16_9PSEU|nr:LuxR family transcriptional regulator [Saccharothrix ecbatanensis]MBB5801035.1 DNA-binding CsgD family transcriptional regulator [Saccharothrix ecbatanensis]
MVGRTAELAVLSETVLALSAVVSVEGEAGVGKSRLVAELLRGPAVRGRRVLVGRCHPIRESFPLGPFVEAVGGIGDGLSGSRLSSVAGALRPLLPELAPWLPPMPVSLDDAVAQRHRVFRGLAEVLGAVSPAVLVLEDLHWMDEQTGDFLTYLLDGVPAGLAVVLTYRGEEAGAALRALTARPPTGTALAHVPLTALDATRTGSLAAAILGLDRVSDEFARYLWERTSGLPFAVEEVLALVRERGLVVRRGDRWARRALDQLEVPRGIRDSTLARVARLSEVAQRLVEVVSVVRTPVTQPVLAAMTGLTDSVEALVEAVDRGVLAEAGGGFGFRHALAAQAVYEHLNPARRMALHGRAAEVLEAVTPTPLGQVAHHLRHAHRPAEWASAAERAAAQAAALGDEDEAVRLLAAVLQNAELPPERRAALAVALGWAALDTLHAREVTEPLRAAIDLDVPAALRGELRFLLAVILGQSGEDPAAQRRLFLAALPDLPHRPDLRAWAMVGLGVTVPPEVSVAEALRWLTDAVALTDGIDDRLLAVFVLGKAGAILMENGDNAWRAIAGRVEELTGGAPRQRREANAYYSLGVAACYTGHLPTAETMLDAAMRADAAQQNRRLAVMIRAGLALTRYCTGRWDGLAAAVEEILADAADYATTRMDLEVVASGLALARGDLDRAAATSRRVTEFAVEIGAYEVVPAAAATWARAALARGDLAGALTGVRTLLAVLDAKGVWAPACWAVPAAVDVLVAGGEQVAARRLADRTADALHGLDAPLAGAVLAYTRGVLDGRPEELATAAAEFERVSAGHEAGRAHEAAAVAWLGAGDERGVTSLRAAVAVYERLGASWDAGRAAALARAHGVSLPARHRSGRRGYGAELSPRERQVAELAVDGRTNREIAEALFVSPNTVGKHMAAVMRKLNARSRTELVRLLVDDPGKDGAFLP